MSGFSCFNKITVTPKKKLFIFHSSVTASFDVVREGDSIVKGESSSQFAMARVVVPTRASFTTVNRRAHASSLMNSPSVAAALRMTRRTTPTPCRGFDDIDIAAETADEDDYAKWQRTPESAAWKNYAESKPEGGSYVVGKRRLDEKFLSELMLALLRNHRRGIKAEAILNKVKSNMELDGYKSVLVGIGRMEQWELAREVIDYVKAEGRERGDEVLTSNWFMALATRRLEEKAYDAACDVFDYMKEFGSVPSGETIEVFAKLTVSDFFFRIGKSARAKRIYPSIHFRSSMIIHLQKHHLSDLKVIEEK